MMQKGLSGFRRFLDVMETVPEIQDAPDAVDLTNVKGRVCYEDVSFHYSDDDTTVLSNVSIEIPAGRSVALVGPSGSGKTTICSLLPRFYDVTAGRITIDGQDIRHLTLKSLRSQIGMVQQDVYLFSERSVIILPTENRMPLTKRSLPLQNVQTSTTLSWNFHSSMKPLSENVVPVSPVVRSSGFPLPVSS